MITIRKSKVVTIEDSKVRLEITTKRFAIRVIAKGGSYKYLECSCGGKLNNVEEVVSHLKSGHHIFHPVDNQEGIEKYLVREPKAKTKKAACKICGAAFDFYVPAQLDYICSDCAERDRPVYGSPLNPREIPAVSQHRVVPTGYYRWPTQTKTEERSRSKKVIIDI